MEQGLTAASEAHPSLVSALLTPGVIYSREELKRILRTGDSTINTGVFRPAGFSSVLLFVTKNKTRDRTQFVDQLDGDVLRWQGQSKGRTDALIIDHRQRSVEVLLFYRDRKYEHPRAAFRFEGQFGYVTHSGKAPVNFVLRRESPELARAAARAETAGAFDPANDEDGRQRILAAIARRQGQPEFRRELLRAYGSRCIISGCEIAEVLEAAHILPYRGSHTNHISNGLLLRADLHTLFDLGLIAVDEVTHLLIVSTALRNSDYGRLQGTPLSKPLLDSDRPNSQALRLHRIRSGL